MHDDDDGVHRWYVNGETVMSMDSEQMMMPSLRMYASAAGGEYTDVGLPETGRLNGTAAKPFVAPYMAVIDIIVNNTHRGEHPFHLHGHDMWIVDSSGEPNGEGLYGPDYVRRDVVSVSAGGWARMRFVADNPGIWVYHCHTVRCGLAGALVGCAQSAAQFCVTLCLRFLTRLGVASQDWHMHAGMQVTIIEAPTELQRRAASGELVTTSPSHQMACEAPQTLMAVARAAVMHKQTQSAGG